jgi:hypothetical protein
MLSVCSMQFIYTVCCHFENFIKKRLLTKTIIARYSFF